MERFGKISNKQIYLFILSFFGSGLLSKKMPGTVGSAFAAIQAVLIFYFFPNYHNIFGILAVMTFIVGAVFCHIFIVKKLFDRNRDPSYVVIDEACGIFFCLYLLEFFVKLSLFNVMFSFVLFRLFDIFKPCPICVVEKLMKQRENMVGLGIMFDDVLAAVFAVGFHILFFRFVF